MRRHIISTIFSKEIKEVLRDKRMLYMVILMPFFLYPAIFFVMGSVGASQQDKLSSQKVTVWLDPVAENSPVFQVLNQDTSLILELRAFEENELKETQKTIGIHLSADYKTALDAGGATSIQILVNESKDLLKFRKRSIQAQLATLNQQFTANRLAEKELSPDFISPFKVQTIDVSPQEGGGGMLASMLPMMILLFIFMGCIYIAIDITAGEKERRTLQTLFTTTATTKEIIAGKFLAVISVGLTSAAMNILSLLLAMQLQAYLLDSSSDVGASLSLSPVAIIWFVVLILLTTVFLGALVLAIILLANSYKEAQSYVSPLMMVVLIPAMMVMLPGMELDMQTVFIPVLNTSLAIVSLLKGSYDTTMLGLVAIMSLLYGFLALYLASLTFSNENVITGEKIGLKDLFSK